MRNAGGGHVKHRTLSAEGPRDYEDSWCGHVKRQTTGARATKGCTTYWRRPAVLRQALGPPDHDEMNGSSRGWRKRSAGARHAVGVGPRDAGVALDRAVAIGCRPSRMSDSKVPLRNRLQKKLTSVVSAMLSKKQIRKLGALQESRAARSGRAERCMRIRCKLAAIRNGKLCQEKHH